MTVRHRCYTARQNTKDRTCWRTCNPVKTPKKRPRRLKNVCLNLSPKQLDVHFLVFCFVFSPRSDEWTVTDSALADYSSQLSYWVSCCFQEYEQVIFQAEFKRKKWEIFCIKKINCIPQCNALPVCQNRKYQWQLPLFLLDSQKTLHIIKMWIKND